MKKLFKWLTTSFGSLFVLIGLGMIYLSLMVDPNQYKSDIESMAEGAGVELAIEGDVEWQFFPLGVRVHQVSFAQQNQSLAGNFSELELSVNWLTLASLGSKSHPLPLSNISLTNGRLLYAIPNQLPLQINHINLNISDMAFDGSEFPVNLSLQAARGLQFFFDADLGITFFDQKVTGFSASAFKLKLDKLKLTGNIQSRDNLEQIEGSINTQGFNLLAQLKTIKQFVPDLYIPEMIDANKVLTDISIKSYFDLEPSDISEAKITVAVDGQAFDIDLLLDQPRRKLTTLISGENLNLALYLPEQFSATSNTALFASLALPMALWHGKSHLELQLDKLELRNTTVSNVYINLFGNQNLFELTSFNADAFNGQINATATLDMRNSAVDFNLQSSIANLDLGAMIDTSTTDLDIDGIIDLEANIQSSGSDIFNIINSIKGGGHLYITSPKYNGINIEQTVCSAVALFSDYDQSNQQWPEDTKLHDLTGSFRIDQGRLIINDYKTGTGNISLSGNGDINFLRQTYRLNNNALLNSSKTSRNGCSVNRLLQNRQIPFRCNGQFGEKFNCKPESNLFKTFIQQSATDSLKRNISKKLGVDKPVNSSQQLMDKSLNP